MKVYFTEFSGGVEREILSKIPSPIIINSINNYCENKDYGNGIVEYMHVLKIYSLTRRQIAPTVEEEFVYKKRSKKVLICPLIKDFEGLLKFYMDEVYLYRVCCESFLEGIKKVRELKIKDFNIDSFELDMNNLFEENNWI